MSRRNKTARGGASVLLSFLGGLFLSRFLWGWIVPDVLPGAVEEGLIVAAVPWGMALKIGALAGLCALVFGRHDHGSSS